MSIFNLYPYINYNNQKSTYLIAKAQIIKPYLSNYNNFYAYTIREGERADSVAYDQYGDATLDWVIYVVNGIIDPYYDWPLSTEDFMSYLENKYNTLPYKLADVSIPSSVAYYYYKGLDTDTPDVINSYNYNMSEETYMALGQPAGWVAKSIYDYEHDLNEAKRDIKLLRSTYLGNFQQQFKDLFING
jgi:Base plate wedge protein 53